jgi:predicted dehydrogenase
VLVELPLAATLEQAQRVIEVQRASGRRAFVDMFSRFSAHNQHLRQAVSEQRYGPLRMLEVENRTALLWPGYHLTLDTIALDMLHADVDLVTALMGRPAGMHVTGLAGRDGRGSAATILLDYPDATARISGSALMPQPYGMRGGWRATFTDAVLEYAMTAGFTGQGPATLTEYTAAGERVTELPAPAPTRR